MILKVNDIWNNLVLGPDIDCPICLEIITNEDNMITNCGHYFHSSCMIKYIVMSKSNNSILEKTLELMGLENQKLKQNCEKKDKKIYKKKQKNRIQ